MKTHCSYQKGTKKLQQQQKPPRLWGGAAFKVRILVKEIVLDCFLFFFFSASLRYNWQMKLYIQCLQYDDFFVYIHSEIISPKRLIDTSITSHIHLLFLLL